MRQPLNFSGRHPDRTKLFTSGRRIHVLLWHHPAPPHGPEPEYTIEAAESDDHVTLTIHKITSDPLRSDPGRPRARPRRETLVELTVALGAPLGDRTLRNLTSAEPIPVTPIATRLEPTKIPEPWSAIENGWYHGLHGARTYGPVTVLTSPITHHPRLHGLREVPHEAVTIRNPNDGVAVLPSPSQVTTLGFEEMGWYYKLTAPNTTARHELTKFARSFERPAITQRS